ncbi:hypothetical protein AMS68_003896 [Peltaster fructicola]|uniref:Uncharacterized protein n=1 Tax=Peltaster fructicola TaxID=286661 RepID=A0A6H0XUS5_9PEZI|nr:hypothetical protein AMS68_003896 [Peltaster fructicola]
MASLQEHKRHKHSYEASSYVDYERPPSKRRKEHSIKLPPHVWDGLSEVRLTRRALQEIDRRTKEKASVVAKDAAPRRYQHLLRSDTRRLDKCAKQGGPDLSRLRGYADRPTKQTMSGRSSRTSKRDRVSGLRASSSSKKPSTTGPYNAEFEQILIDNGVYPDGYELTEGGQPPEPHNLDELRRRLAQARRSLSPSRFSNEKFQDFRGRRPAAPNYFLEVKGPSGRGDVLQRQATYAGAIGARAMHHLQNYGTEPSYDGNAYSTTATYFAGQGILRLYATHPRKSAGGSIEYHTTVVDTYVLVHTSDAFRQGVAAFRNARDLSKEHRDRFINEANAVARTLPADALSSRMSQSTTDRSVVAGESPGSETSMDELALDHEKRSKRPRQQI